MKRVGLFGLSLVLALGTGVMAQEPSPSASAEATPVYAPEDMASPLPSEVGGIAVKKFNVSPDEAPANLAEQFGSDEVLPSVLSPFGKEAADMRLGFGYAEVEDGLVIMWAIRVDGVSAEDVTEGFIAAFTGTSDATMPPENPTPTTVTTEDIAGRQVAIIRQSEEPNFRGAFYPVGEVLFVIYAHSEDSDSMVEEVLAELP